MHKDKRDKSDNIHTRTYAQLHEGYQFSFTEVKIQVIRLLPPRMGVEWEGVCVMGTAQALIPAAKNYPVEPPPRGKSGRITAALKASPPCGSAGPACNALLLHRVKACRDDHPGRPGR